MPTTRITSASEHNASLGVIVMAKRAIPGRVKTRLVGALTSSQAAEVHRAMLECVLTRVAPLASDARLIVALDAPSPYDPHTLPPALRDDRCPWELLDQGSGELGDRMGRIWREIGGGPVVFFGADAPDAPLEQALRAARQGLDGSRGCLIGPTGDGGYWTLGCPVWQPMLFESIDWGSDRVYDQTLARAREASIGITNLPAWDDVDTPQDLAMLRRRLQDAAEPPLRLLARRLEGICKEPLT